MTDLSNAAFLAAHAAGEPRSLATLYAQAADKQSDADARYFFLTQAYVFALEAGDSRAKQLHALLKAAGREE